jgi:hypothetical protein
MEFFGPLFVVVICGAGLGAAMQLGMAMSLLSTESIDSPNFLLRWSYRICIFCMTFFISLMISPSILFALFPSLIQAAQSYELAGLWYVALCLPLATTLFFLDLRFVRRCDARMMAGRKAFLRKYGGNNREN